MKTRKELRAMHLLAARDALAGITPYRAGSEYMIWTLKVLPEEKEERKFRLRSWLHPDEYLHQLSPEELCLFILFVREAAS